MRKVNILWTGGLDSTCRVAELSRLPVEVQPYYIIDQNRYSKDKELNAIRQITSVIRNNKSTKCHLNDVIIIDMDSIPSNQKVTDAYLVLKEKYALGSQYDWLARFAMERNIILEMGLEKNATGKAFKTLTGECELIEEKSDGIDVLLIDKSKSSAEAIAIFGNLRFPSKLWETEKNGEIEMMKDLGLGEIVKMTWFCHRPIFGMTCGHCNPCKDAINEGMTWRISKLGYVLGTIRLFMYDPIVSIINRIKG